MVNLTARRDSSGRSYLRPLTRHAAQGSRVAIVHPSPVILRAFRVREAGEFQPPAVERVAMKGRSALLPRVQHVDDEQTAVSSSPVRSR